MVCVGMGVVGEGLGAEMGAGGVSVRGEGCECAKGRVCKGTCVRRDVCVKGGMCVCKGMSVQRDV